MADGPGAVADAITALAQRLVGFELQMGPFAVAELRAADLLRARNAPLPPGGMRFFVTDTLDDPHAEVAQLGQGMALISQSRVRANKVKADTPVTVVIGNPPYRQQADRQGGWVEDGDGITPGRHSLLDDFRDPDTARHFHNLKNLYVYFWRWGLWKVFESTPTDPVIGDAGIVSFISTSGYVSGPGFTAMRRYVREHASHGWIIDLTPEGQTPDVPTRIFPGVRQKLAIGMFLRQPGTPRDEPAEIRYVAVTGLQSEKFAALAALSLNDPQWRLARTGWTDPFTPESLIWDTYPALNDMMPWTSPGVTGNRRWPYSPSVDVLTTRWNTLLSASDPGEQAVLLKSTRDRDMATRQPRLGGSDTAEVNGSLAQEAVGVPVTVQVGYRAFDRQYVIADPRVLDMPRRTLWDARIAGQVFTIEMHAKPISGGPGVIFSGLIPDLDHFKGSEGGRTLPFLNPGGRPNFTPGLLATLSALVGEDAFGGQIAPQDLLAYIAAVVSHPAYTNAFADDLTTPGIRVPVTADPALFAYAVRIGRSVIWAQTYGSQYADSSNDRPVGNVRFAPGDSRRILLTSPMKGMPEQITYSAADQTLRMGTASWAPVDQAVFDYSVGGKGVLKSWFNYRKRIPGGKRTSPLDNLHLETWPGEWSTECTELLSVLTRLVALEPAQADLLQQILSGPLLSRATLAEHGVAWPVTENDRKPTYEAPPAEEASALESDTLF